MSARPSRAFVVSVALLACAIVFALSWRPATVVPDPHRDRAGAVRQEPRGPSEGTPRPERVRNVFVFDDPPPLALAPRPVETPAAVPPPLTLPPRSPVALVGFVRRSDGLRAALSIHGDVSVLAKDETAAGYVVLAIDEDRGVTLRTPDGGETTLAPPAP